MQLLALMAFIADVKENLEKSIVTASFINWHG